MIYHAYKPGYSVLPQLKKIEIKDIFQISNNLNRYLEEKKISIKNQKCFLEHNITDEIYKAACDFIITNYPVKLEEPYDFCNIAMQIQEDLAIHRLDENTDWLAVTHICCPSSWSPEEKIGESFDKIHEVIPGMSLKNSRKLIEAMTSGVYERYVWGLIYENELNYHPSIIRKGFDRLNPQFWVKVERQIMVGLSEYKSLLFILKQTLIPEDEVDKPLLRNALVGMTNEQKRYKSISEDLIEYL